MSWLRPSKRSASVALPAVESNSYRFSTFSQGRARRCLLISSRRWVNSFSLRRNSVRPASHSACETTFGRTTSSVALAMVILLGWGWSGMIVYGGLQAEFDGDGCESAAACDERCGCYAHWTHGLFLTCHLRLVDCD